MDGGCEGKLKQPCFGKEVMLMKLGQKLRYKDYQLMKKEEVDRARMSVPREEVQEVTSVKD